ncbi:MAG: hypothetical protein LQ340_002499 [Diploschistes diacapsis]|nr:MAG: hypothetical protein LQ340_002499 [Diploschistes diacapsis]
MAGNVRIPLEVFFNVLDYADEDVVEQLYTATSGNRRYHAAVLEYRWQNISIVEEDIYYGSQHTADSRHLIASALRKTTTENNDVPAEPASYIRCLRADYARPYAQHPSYKRTFSPDRGNLSLFHLLTRCSSLRELYRVAPLCQKALKLITHSSHHSLQRLRLQIPSPGHPSQARNWRCLQSMMELTKLEIGDVSPQDATELGMVVGELQNLTDLTLMMLESEPGSSSIFNFLTNLHVTDRISHQTVRYFPSGLKSLTLCDPTETSMFTSAVRGLFPPLSMARISIPLLEDLWLDCQNTLTLRVMLAWWELPILERLTIPSVTCDPRGLSGALTWTNRILYEVLEPVISMCRDTIHQVVLLDVWQNKDRHSKLKTMNTAWNWEFGFVITDLVFGTRSRRHMDLALSHLFRMKSKARYRRAIIDCYLYQQLFDTNQLHESLIRLRIDQLDFYEDAFEDLFRNNFPKLRILILYPWNPQPFRSDDERYPKRIDGFLEGRLAQRILQYAGESIPELCVLAIGGYKFWLPKAPYAKKMVERPLLTPKLWRQVWHLDHAMADTAQREAIRSSLDARDWQFLSDIPPHPRKEDPYASSSHPDPEKNVDERNRVLFRNCAASQMIRNRNYMVLHPEDISPEAHEYFSASSSAYTRPLHWLHNLAIWDSEASEQLAKGAALRNVIGEGTAFPDVIGKGAALPDITSP